jgi:hypothetical protein
VAETSGLLNRRTGNSRTEGSNPSVSASAFLSVRALSMSSRLRARSLRHVRALVVNYLFGPVWLHERIARAASPTGVFHENASLDEIVDVAAGGIL